MENKHISTWHSEPLNCPPSIPPYFLFPFHPSPNSTLIRFFLGSPGCSTHNSPWDTNTHTMLSLTFIEEPRHSQRERERQGKYFLCLSHWASGRKTRGRRWTEGVGPGPLWALGMETKEPRDRWFEAQKGSATCNVMKVRVKVARWCDRGREREQMGRDSNGKGCLSVSAIIYVSVYGGFMCLFVSSSSTLSLP